MVKVVLAVADDFAATVCERCSKLALVKFQSRKGIKLTGGERDRICGRGGGISTLAQGVSNLSGFKLVISMVVKRRRGGY